MDYCQIENCPQIAQPRAVRVHIGRQVFLVLRLCTFCAHELQLTGYLRDRIA